jgi:Mor family transcriptional regulator
VNRGLMNAVHLTQADSELAAAVIKVLKESTTVTQRILAAKALERWGKPDAIPVLEQAGKDKNGMLKKQAQRAITAINARKNAQP